MGWGGYPPKKISIHASAKEATLFSGLLSLKSEFQSTPPRRRRHIPYRTIRYHYDFNPRLREGGDNISTETLDAIKISIHASAKEATSIFFSSTLANLNFNPRLREGGDGSGTPTVYTPFDFNPRLREGGDRQHLIS